VELASGYAIDLIGRQGLDDPRAQRLGQIDAKPFGLSGKAVDAIRLTTLGPLDRALSHGGIR